MTKDDHCRQVVAAVDRVRAGGHGAPVRAVVPVRRRRLMALEMSGGR